MTAQEAKVLSIKIWAYLSGHPEIKMKRHLPEKLYSEIANLKNQCPLCELFYDEDPPCPQCPLGHCARGSAYERWLGANSKKLRETAAKIILEKIQVWNPEV